MSQLVTDQQGQVHSFPDDATPDMIANALGLSQGNAAGPRVAEPLLSAASAFGLDPKVLHSIMQVESGGKLDAVSSAGARGPFQFMPDTARRYGLKDPHDLSQAASAAAQFMRDNLAATGGDLDSALMRYHGGPDQTNWGPLTRAYPAKIRAAMGATGDGDTPTPGAGDGIPRPENTVNGPLTPTAKWDATRSVGNAFWQGGGIPYMAAVQATKETGGLPTGDNKARWMEIYHQAHKQYSDAREGYNQENPTQSTVQELGGALGPVLAGTGLVSGAVRALPVVGEFLSGAARGSGPLWSALSQGASGALQGAAASGISSGLSDRPLGEQLELGAATGFGLGSTVSPIANKLISAISPTVDKGKAALAQWADAQGIPLRVSQLSENPITKWAARQFGTAAKDAEQRGVITQGLASTIGEDASSLGPDVLERARNRIGQTFDDVAKNTSVPLDQTISDDLANIRQSVSASALGKSKRRALIGQLDKIENNLLVGNGLSGEDYSTITKFKGDLWNLQKHQDSTVANFAEDIRNRLDDALERGSPPEQIVRLREARQQYKNLKTLQGVANQMGPEGVLEPSDTANLLAQVLRRNPDMALGQGGDIAQLARTAREFVRPNGDAEGQWWKELVANGVIGGGLAAGTYYATQNPGTAAGAASIPLAAMIGGRYLGRRAASSAFINDLANPIPGGIRPRTMIPLASEAINR